MSPFALLTKAIRLFLVNQWMRGRITNQSSALCFLREQGWLLHYGCILE